MQQTLAVPEKGNTKPSAPGSKAWSWLIGKRVLIRLKSGLVVSGRCVRVTCNIVTISGPVSIQDRDGAPILVQDSEDGTSATSSEGSSVHVDGGGISFVVEAAHRD